MEKFYNSEEWMTYLIDLFLKPGAVVASELANPVSAPDAKHGCGAVIAPQPPFARLAPSSAYLRVWPGGTSSWFR